VANKKMAITADEVSTQLDLLYDLQIATDGTSFLVVVVIVVTIK
jgi:hypothetical protein